MLENVGGASDFIGWLVDKLIFFKDWSTTSWILAAMAGIVMMWLFQWLRMQSGKNKSKRLRF